MTDEMKPVNCGCGGEAKIIHCDYYGDKRTSVYCTDCGIQTGYYPTETEAVTAWNRAMSGVAKDINVPNKTAKVKKQFVLITGGLGGVMPSCECGWAVNAEWKYCPSCGARLEWE